MASHAPTPTGVSVFMHAGYASCIRSRRSGWMWRPLFPRVTCGWVSVRWPDRTLWWNDKDPIMNQRRERTTVLFLLWFVCTYYHLFTCLARVLFSLSVPLNLCSFSTDTTSGVRLLFTGGENFFRGSLSENLGLPIQLSCWTEWSIWMHHFVLTDFSLRSKWQGKRKSESNSRTVWGLLNTESQRYWVLLYSGLLSFTCSCPFFLLSFLSLLLFVPYCHPERRWGDMIQIYFTRN